MSHLEHPDIADLLAALPDEETPEEEVEPEEEGDEVIEEEQEGDEKDPEPQEEPEGDAEVPEPQEDHEGDPPVPDDPIGEILTTFMASPAYQITFPIHALVDQKPEQPFEVKEGYYTIRPEADDDTVGICGLSWTAEGLAAIPIPATHPLPLLQTTLRCRGDRNAVDHLPHFVQYSDEEGEGLELWWLPNEEAIFELFAEVDGGATRVGTTGYNVHDAIPNLEARLNVFNPNINN